MCGNIIQAVEKVKPFLIIGLASLVTTLLLWLPFILRLESFWGIRLPQNGMATVVANFDGPYYIVAAKTLYDPSAIKHNFEFNLPPIYYSAHYPLFPLLIRGLITILPFLGYTYAMLSVTVIASILAACVFYLLLGEFGVKQRLWITILFLIFPARWFIVRSIGSPEPLFLLSVMASVYFAKKEKWSFAGILGSLAQATKPPGILLFIAYIIALIAPHWQKLAHTSFSNWLAGLAWRAYPILLIPLTLLTIYVFYGLRYGDFFAYFNSGDNIHLLFPPFRVFNPSQVWVGTFWLEDVIWIYLLVAVGFVYLIQQKRALFASLVGIFFFSIFFVAHRDIARYSLPVVPFLFIAYEKVFSAKWFKWVVLLLIVPIYLSSLAFIANNVTPISDWRPLL